MRIAFYAPLKPPDHPVPSGDRRIARLFLDALRLTGHEPRWRRAPGTAPQLWLTYHLYYKAPDWLGPAISKALGIPYVIAEASFAPKRMNGAWGVGHRAVAAALRQADAVLGLNPADREGVLPLLHDPQCWITLPPFLDAGVYPLRQPQALEAARLIAVAMMRPGDKLASYRLLSVALEKLLDLPWSIEIVGDGPARGEVERALAPLGARVVYRGKLDDDAVAAALASADLFLWPAINEAFGMALLEAQASGLPVIAGDRGGIGAIVVPGATGLLAPPGDAAAFATAARRLIVDTGGRAAMAVAAQQKVRREHDLPQAADRLASVIRRLSRKRAA